MPCHDLAECQRGIQIVLIIFHRLGNGFPHRLEPRKVNGAGNFVLGENFLQKRLVAHVALDERDVFAGDLRHAAQALGVRIAEIIDHNGRVARLDQLYTGVAADVSGAAGDQYVHFIFLLTRMIRRCP